MSGNRFRKPVSLQNSHPRKAALLAGHIDGRIFPAPVDAGNVQRITFNECDGLEFIPFPQGGVDTLDNAESAVSQVFQRYKSIRVPPNLQPLSNGEVGAFHILRMQESRYEGGILFQAYVQKGKDGYSSSVSVSS